MANGAKNVLTTRTALFGTSSIGGTLFLLSAGKRRLSFARGASEFR